MATREIAAFDEAGLELEAPQGSDTYLAKKPVHFEEAITTDSIIDGRDVAADGALAASAVQPGDIGSAAAENVTYFATTAQGALADSAVQPGDIDAVTVVNAATYDLLVTDKILHVTYTVTDPVTSLTLPSAQVVTGRFIVIKDAGGNAGVNNITIDTEGSETIDGSATLIIVSNYQAVNLYSDGSDWFIY